MSTAVLEDAVTIQELSERVAVLEQQLAHVLHEIINLREGKDYGERE